MACAQAAESKASDAKAPAPAQGAAAGASAQASMMDAMKTVLRMPAIWALAFTYFFIYVASDGPRADPEAAQRSSACALPLPWGCTVRARPACVR
jgi:hypothetical protein